MRYQVSPTVRTWEGEEEECLSVNPGKGGTQSPGRFDTRNWKATEHFYSLLCLLVSSHLIFSSFWLQDSFCILFTAAAIYSLDLQLHVMPGSQSLYFNSKCVWRNVIDPGCIRQHLLSNQSRSEGGGNRVQTWLLMGGLTLYFEVGKGIPREGAWLSKTEWMPKHC